MLLCRSRLDKLEQAITPQPRTVPAALTVGEAKRSVWNLVDADERQQLLWGVGTVGFVAAASLLVLNLISRK